MNIHNTKCVTTKVSGAHDEETAERILNEETLGQPIKSQENQTLFF